ncbi:hypothetical protein M3A96_07620 [Helcobacillus massiliensis]|uniref:hypothetical protein n=1 Tax=Helcobacillus massiliensis TaxID=521392 RepID=UPI0021A6C3E7|nr:hypothetical protein [Helcobacillus massiliensis]MCT1557982.1 hypothetical protein [Helcobacillus massiliensis]MCT2037040.1 hypothetical protein [Helcobacillus massiliensis]MCT2332838.1 hypothetical protein [Helcobacillus massiliensis]
MMDTTHLNRRMLLASVGALGITTATTGCGMLGITRGSRPGLEGAPSDKRPGLDGAPSEVEPVLHSDVSGPLELWKRENALIDLGVSHPSVGKGFSIVGAVDGVYRDSILEARVRHVSKERNNGAGGRAGGDGGRSYLHVWANGGIAGTVDLRVVYCFRDIPDQAGQCNQTGASPGQDVVDTTFTIRVM